MSQRAPNVDRLYSDIEWALAHGLPPRELVPMLEKLLRHAPATSPHAIFAKRQLAELMAQSAPWRAARLARDVLEVLPEDDRAWAVLGLSYTLLGHFHSAERAYREAVLLAPYSPWYAHNLGHLLDVALDRPKDALRYLRTAHRGLPHEPEIAASLAHALARAGRWNEAVPLLSRALGKTTAEAEAQLSDWLTRDPPGSLPHRASVVDEPAGLEESALENQENARSSVDEATVRSKPEDGSNPRGHGSTDPTNSRPTPWQNERHEASDGRVGKPATCEDAAID